MAAADGVRPGLGRRAASAPASAAAHTWATRSQRSARLPRGVGSWSSPSSASQSTPRSSSTASHHLRSRPGSGQLAHTGPRATVTAVRRAGARARRPSGRRPTSSPHSSGAACGERPQRQGRELLERARAHERDHPAPRRPARVATARVLERQLRERAGRRSGMRASVLGHARGISAPADARLPTATAPGRCETAHPRWSPSLSPWRCAGWLLAAAGACGDAPHAPAAASDGRRPRERDLGRPGAPKRSRSIQRADLLIDRDALAADLDAGRPRAPGSDLLALPDARDARADPRPLHRAGALRGAASRRRCGCSPSQAPEYEMDASHGLVRWRISRGLLVSKRGRDGARPPADRGPPARRRRRRDASAPACTSRSRSPTSTPRSPRGLAARSTTSPSRGST